MEKETIKKPRLDILILEKELPQELSQRLSQLDQSRPDVEWGANYNLGVWFDKPDVPFPTAKYKPNGNSMGQISEYGSKAVYALIDDILSGKI